ncbi:MAG: tetratricopeptide repeat protein, partial [Myxococcota bacterium]
ELARRSGEAERAVRAYGRAQALGPLPPGRQADLAALHRERGDLAAFAEAFAVWCDDPAADAAAADHASLAETLEALDRLDDAHARVERALALSDREAKTWDLAARVRDGRGDPTGAIVALRRAADLGIENPTRRLLRAAELSEPTERTQALELLRSAVRRDPASLAAQAALARIAAALDELAEAEEAAGRALDMAHSAASPDRELRLEIALIGGRCALRRGRLESAAHFMSAALAADPEHPEALATHGEALAELGDLRGARRPLERRLAQDETYPERAHHLAIVGRCLEAEGDHDAARQRAEAALEADPNLDEAHGLLVRLHRRADRLEEGIACLERWAEQAAAPAQRAARWLEAAEWELSSGERRDAAEAHLRQVVDAEPVCARGWELLASLLWECERPDEALEAATAGLARVDDPELRSALSMLRGQALERRGERDEAAEAFASAASADPRRAEAALASARLWRGIGDWSAAGGVLRKFVEQHPGGDPERLSEALLQLGRLQAGPLEDVEGAIGSYRRAVSTDPERVEARAALAEFLSQSPDSWDEALGQHRALLDSDPTRVASLRRLLSMVRSKGWSDAVAHGVRILQALGVASPAEAEEAGTAPVHPLAGPQQLEDPLWEALRRVACEAAAPIATAVEGSETPSAGEAGDPASAFRAAALAAESRLAAAALLPLPAAEVGEVLTVIAALALDASQVRGEGRLVNALSSAVARRVRRRLRRTLDGFSFEDVAAVDFVAWRTEVRALAAAVALDEGGGDLRTALVALLSEGAQNAELQITEGADLTPLVAACPPARALLRRALRTWLESFPAESG